MKSYNHPKQTDTNNLEGATNHTKKVSRLAKSALALSILLPVAACAPGISKDEQINEQLQNALNGDQQAIEAIKNDDVAEYNGVVEIKPNSNIRTSSAFIDNSSDGSSNKTNEFNDKKLTFVNPVIETDLNNSNNSNFMGAYYKGKMVWVSVDNATAELNPDDIRPFDGEAEASLIVEDKPN